jgi:hypothetical protein
LLLGMKGTMSEMDLSVFRQQSMEAMRQKARRGELHLAAAVGHLKTEDGRIEKDPDRRVQDGISLVFREFAELQSVRQVLLWFRQENVVVPAIVQGRGKRPMESKMPVYHTLHHILTDPAYAGSYAYGRRGTRVTIEGGSTCCSPPGRSAARLGWRRCCRRGASHRPKTRAAIDAPDRHRGTRTNAADDETCARTQDLSVSAARYGDRSAEPGVGSGHNANADWPRLFVSRGDHGLDEPRGSGVAAVAATTTQLDGISRSDPLRCSLTARVQRSSPVGPLHLQRLYHQGDRPSLATLPRCVLPNCLAEPLPPRLQRGSLQSRNNVLSCRTCRRPVRVTAAGSMLAGDDGECGDRRTARRDRPMSGLQGRPDIGPNDIDDATMLKPQRPALRAGVAPLPGTSPPPGSETVGRLRAQQCASAFRSAG